MRLEYFEWNDELWNGLLDLGRLQRLFHYLVTATGGDVEQALEIMESLKARGILPQGTDLDQFRRMLEEQDQIRVDEAGEASLTARGGQSLRRSALEHVFGRMGKRGAGDHAVPQVGRGGQETSETRPYRHGDELHDVDFRKSFTNALRRTARGGAARLDLNEDDLEVRDSEHLASCATVLLLDISHSMILYGEDRITPAKQVALALVELILSRYPKDSLDVVLFGDDAIPVSLDQLPYVQVGPYHTNTKAALGAARQILRHRKSANKQVILITDGKPSVITDREGVPYRNTFGLDEKIVNKTLDEAIALRRERIPITTFMIASDPYLQQFVTRLSELNRGKAYFTDLGRLGGHVLVDFIRNRRRRI